MIIIKARAEGVNEYCKELEDRIYNQRLKIIGLTDRLKQTETALAGLNLSYCSKCGVPIDEVPEMFMISGRVYCRECYKKAIGFASYCYLYHSIRLIL